VHIRETAKRSLDRGETFYTPVGGTPELKNAVIQRMAQDYGLQYNPQQILISCGGKHCLYNLLQAIVDPGDEVIILAPYWVSYPEMVDVADGVPVIVSARAEDRFLPDPQEVESRITRRTKALMINSPSNPSGVLYPLPLLQELARLAEKHDLLVISDEIYSKLIYDGLTYTPFATLPGMKDRTITVNGVSKTYAMTGFRIGYLASTRVDLVKAATNLQSQSTSNPGSTAQAAAVEALTGPQDEVERMRRVFEKRRDLMMSELDKIEGLSAFRPDGTFYTFVKTEKFYGKGKVSDSATMAQYLLDTQHVACVPGGPFGSEAHVRLSFATSEDAIVKGLERIAAACRELG
jgi:aspartate aminotransferase